MKLRDFIKNGHRRPRRRIDLDKNPILLVIAVSVLPTVVLLVISYFQSIAYAKANLENIIKTATTKTDKLLEDAETMLHRSNIDLQNAKKETAVKILQRRIYNDFRFREAGFINQEGLLILSSLGIVDPPKPVSFTKIGFNPDNLKLQILGPGRSQIMQERSIALALRGSGKLSGLYLLVDPVMLANFLEAIPNQDLGADGFIAFVTKDGRLLSSIYWYAS